MKEVTYEDWLRNPTPRVMWVWDSNPEKAIKRKVIYFTGKPVMYPVISIPEDETGAVTKFKHCAEIGRQRRMTNKELSRWLREKPAREWKYSTDNQIHTNSDYSDDWADSEVYEKVVIRENDSDWREPLMEV